VLDALEIRNAAGHTEIMLTARGPVLVESAARMGGGQTPEIISSCFGTNQVDLLALTAAKPDEFDRLPAEYQLLRQVRYVSLINPREQGVIPSHETMSAVRALPSYVEAVMWHPEGQPLPRTIDVATQPGFVYLISDDPAQVATDYENLRQLERDYLYDPGKGAPK
jgi:biotin carboxylase